MLVPVSCDDIFLVESQEEGREHRCMAKDQRPSNGIQIVMGGRFILFRLGANEGYFLWMKVIAGKDRLKCRDEQLQSAFT
jgi:hypothetical protein